MTPLPTLAFAAPLLAASCFCGVSSTAFARVLGEAVDEPVTSAPARPSPDASSPDGSAPGAPPSLGAALPLVPALLPALVLGIEHRPLAQASAFSGRTGDERGGVLFRAFLHDTLSAVLPDRRTEIAMPFAAIDYRAPEAHDHGYRIGHDGDYSLRRVDLQLRRFARNGREGLYAGTLMRASWMDGEAYDPLTNDADARGGSEANEDRDDDLSRIGAGVVLGLRGRLRMKALPGQLYWGANLNVGRWLGGSPTRLAAELEPSRNADRYFADVELAKVGMRF